MLKKVILFVAAAMCMIGCSLDEVEEKCGVLTINIAYKYTNDDGSNTLQDVRGVTFYVFDNTTGTLTNIYQSSEEDVAKGRFNIPSMPTGDYTVVAWAGTENSLSANGFKVVQMDGRTTYEEQAVEIGKTSKTDFFMMIDYEEVPEGMRGQITPKNQLQDLYFAVDDHVVVNEDVDTNAEFEFIRNTSVLNVNVDGTKYLGSREGDPLQIYVVGANGRYDWTNTVASNAREVLYQPYKTTVTTDDMTALMKILRLELDAYTDDGESIKIYVVDPKSTEIDPTTGLIKPLREFDLMNIIEQQCTAAGVALTQDFLDETYQFNINLTLNVNLDVTVELVDWVVVKPKPQL